MSASGGDDRRSRYNVVSISGSRASSLSKRTSVGVDLRLVIIASLVVAMLLIQVILVETYSTKRTKPEVPFTLSVPSFAPTLTFGLLPTGDSDSLSSSSSSSASSSSASSTRALEGDPVSLFENAGEATVIEPPAVRGMVEPEKEEVRITLSPTRALEQVDIETLEMQLKELQEIQDNEDDAFDLSKEGQPPRPDSASLPTPPPIVAQIPAQDREKEGPIHYSSATSVSASSSKEHHHHSSRSSSSSTHTSKACKARRHVFKNYKGPPRIVCFVHDKTDGLDPLWKIAFRNLGYQETQNPSLATFLMTRHSSESKTVREVCLDSQVFNHLKSTRGLTNPVSLSKSVLRHSSAPQFFPQSITYGGFSSSASYTTKKSACTQFIARAHEFLNVLASERNAFLSAYVEKHDKTVARLSFSGLKKILDAHKKSGSCLHSDDTTALQLFKNVYISPKDHKVCMIRTLVYVPTQRPLFAFMAPKAAVVRCSSAARGELFIFDNMTRSEFVESVRPLVALKERFVSEGRFPTVESASIALQEIVGKMKRAVGEAVAAARSKLELLPARFGLLSADFVLDAHSLQPTLVKITDVPQLTLMERQLPGIVHSLLLEVIRSQQQLVLRSWSNSGGVLRPERLRSLTDFELVMYEILVSGAEAARDAVDDVVSTDSLKAMSATGTAQSSMGKTWISRVFPFP